LLAYFGLPIDGVTSAVVKVVRARQPRRLR
jgi:hypothetical protein